jgi:hypothetical protein
MRSLEEIRAEPGVTSFGPHPSTPLLTQFTVDQRLRVCLSVDQVPGLGRGFEHASVTLDARFGSRTPTWEEMCRVKSVVWHDEEEAYQVHPRKSEYVNLHDRCLHLWRDVEIKK